jgi:hypothetical protein
MTRITPALQGPSPGLECLPPAIIEDICHHFMLTHKGPMQPNETRYTKYKLAGLSCRKYPGSVQVQRLFHTPCCDNAKQGGPAPCKQDNLFHLELEQQLRDRMVT